MKLSNAGNTFQPLFKAFLHLFLTYNGILSRCKGWLLHIFMSTRINISEQMVVTPIIQVYPNVWMRIKKQIQCPEYMQEDTVNRKWLWNEFHSMFSSNTVFVLDVELCWQMWMENSKGGCGRDYGSKHLAFWFNCILHSDSRNSCKVHSCKKCRFMSFEWSCVRGIIPHTLFSI